MSEERTRRKKRGEYLPPDSDYEYYHLPELTVFEPEAGLMEPIGFLHFEWQKPVEVDPEVLANALAAAAKQLRRKTKRKLKGK